MPNSRNRCSPAMTSSSALAAALLCSTAKHCRACRCWGDIAAAVPSSQPAYLSQCPAANLLLVDLMDKVAGGMLMFSLM